MTCFRVSAATLAPVLWVLALPLPAGASLLEGEGPGPPAIVRSPAAIGQVLFPHSFHADDLGIECGDCHHEVNAQRLQMPHEEYFDDFWIDCRICHRAEVVRAPGSCRDCHHGTPSTIADETLSSKVVVHKSCWGCHESGTGSEASRSCSFCHKGGEEGEP
jgi:hypothetical protein